MHNYKNQNIYYRRIHETICKNMGDNINKSENKQARMSDRRKLMNIEKNHTFHIQHYLKQCCCIEKNWDNPVFWPLSSKMPLPPIFKKIRMGVNVSSACRGSNSPVPNLKLFSSPFGHPVWGFNPLGLYPNFLS